MYIPNSNSTFGGTFSDTRLTVNMPGKEPGQCVDNTLSYSFPTPTAASNAGAKLKITISIGESSGNMFSATDYQFGNMLCDGFDSLRPIKSNNKLTYILKYSEDNATGEEKPICTLTWSDIISTAAEGVCPVTVVASGFGGTLDGQNTYYFYKSLAATEICYFRAFPASACPGDKITLEWKVINVTSGYILPGGYDIFAAGTQTTSSCQVIMPSDSRSFFLYASGTTQSVYREVAVFIPPPLIELTLEGRKVSWNCHYALKYELGQNGVYSQVQANDRLVLESGITTVAMRCSGSKVTEEEIQLVYSEATITFVKRIHSYAAYKVVDVSWNVPEGHTAALYIWDTTRYNVSVLSKGNWQYVYSLETNVTPELIVDQGASGALKFRL